MYMALTTQLVETLQDALDKAGHDVKVPSRPNTNDVEIICSLLGTTVSEVFKSLEETAPVSTAVMTQTKHSSWCTDHKTFRDGQDVDEVCRSSVTIAGITVDIEDCPTWPTDERRQVVPPDLPETWVNPADARALAAALWEAVRLIEQRD